MIDQLFGSKTRVKLLKLFYSNPNRSFYVREITRKIDEQINSVRRELSNLLSIGIISSDAKDNNKLYYEVNQKFDYYRPLAEIFGGGVRGASVRDEEVNPELEKLNAIGNVQLALMTGQFTRDESSGIDMLIVGDVNQTKLDKYIGEMEQKENKEVRYTVMTPREFKYREKIHDRFLSLVLESKRLALIDKQGWLSAGNNKQEKKEKDKE